MDDMHQLLKLFGMSLDPTRDILLIGLVLSRTLPVILQVPFLGGQQSPPEVKMSLGLLFALVIWPITKDNMVERIPIFAVPFLLLMLKELFIGFSIGYVMSHIFASVETAGRFIDTARGAAMAEVLAPQTKSRATPIGTLYSQLLVVLFMVFGGHRIFIETFCYSFESLPIHEALFLKPGFGAFIDYVTQLTSHVLGIAVILSAPAIAATLLADLVFGILNRVAPQLNAYFMSMPAKAMGALVLMLISIHTFIERLVDFMQESLIDIKAIIKLMQLGS